VPQTPQQGSSATSDVSGQMERAGHTAEGVAARTAEQAREAGQSMHGVADNLSTALDKSLRDQPMATLAVAAALGFVLGALWKS
jgi:ElaB/YqjD/DUF883 family membrane-anchored ribosome-binding protein